MRFRLGVAVGFGVGYYLGTAAGRERYDELNRLFRKIRRSDAFDTATDKAKAVVDLGVERAKDVIEDKIHHLGSDRAPTDPVTDDVEVGKTWPPSMDPVVRP
jgi:hypothetical protein